MIQIKISRTIEITNYPPELLKACQKVLTIDNPLFYKLIKATGNRARAFWGTPKEFKYWREKDGVMIIPRGMRVRLLTWLDKVGIKYEMEENFVDIKL